ncbi:hypothetical protein [Natronorubrum tibetense]|uniref:hypothetical protein n=1 Tax=Natronorubrum tibetense TaxID=63128 RepID=UPI000362A844|nr:hypothetical protein [Natronorubrum tibetense]
MKVRILDPFASRGFFARRPKAVKQEDAVDAEGPGQTTLSERSVVLELADIDVNVEQFEVGLVAAGFGQSLAEFTQIIVFPSDRYSLRSLPSSNR